MTEPEIVPVGPGPEEDEQVAKLDVEVTPEVIEVESDEEDRGSTTVTDLEALLFVAERPLTRQELRTVARLSVEEIDEKLGDLEVQLSERGIRLVNQGDRVMLGTSPESGALIARYLGADAVRLSPAALETLAIIAYRQPVTRGVIERIRGVDSGHVVRGLLHRRLIHEQGRQETPGRPILYGTSMEFMERFGLTSLDDLPPLEAEIAAQLAQAEEDAKTEAKDKDGSDGSDQVAGQKDATEGADAGLPDAESEPEGAPDPDA